MNILNDNEHFVLQYIKKNNNQLTVYQLTRYLSTEMDPDVWYECLKRVRDLGLIVLKHEDSLDGFPRWNVTEEGVHYVDII